MEYPSGLSPVHFLRLTLSRGAESLSTNFYMRGLEEANYKAIRQLPKARLQVETKTVRSGDRWRLTTELHNTSPYPALMVRLKVSREKTGDRILPAIYNDNYITLMPDEHRTIHIELSHSDTRGEAPRIVTSGFNVA
jgi:hypothetical protein